MAYFPMYVDITDAPCLVVGGGHVALRKVEVLTDFGARVTVVAAEVCSEIKDLAGKLNAVPENGSAGKPDAVPENGTAGKPDAVPENGPADDMPLRVQIFERPFAETDLNGQTMVIAATDDKQVNHEIAEACRAQKIPVNAVDQKEDCSFIFSSYVKEADLVAAFSSGGSSPLLTQFLKKKEKEILKPWMGDLNAQLGQWRPYVQAHYETEAQRKAAYRKIADEAFKQERTLTEEEILALIGRD